MLKADLGTSSKVLTDLFKDIWETDAIPDDWTKGLIVMITVTLGSRRLLKG